MYSSKLDIAEIGDNEKVRKAIKIVVEKMLPYSGVSTLMSKIAFLGLRVKYYIAYTDGQIIFLSIKLVNKYSVKELADIIVHEFLHIVLGHPYRATSKRHPFLWNVAADIMVGAIKTKYIYGYKSREIIGILKVIKRILVKEGFSSKYKLIANIIDDVVASPDQWSTEKLYMKLNKIVNLDRVWREICEALKKFLPNRHDWSDIDHYGLYPLAIELKIIENIYNGIRDIPWNIILRKYIVASSTGNDILSWKKPNKRLISSGYYLPRKFAPSVRKLVVAVDVSGSIEREQYIEAFEELAWIVSSLNIEVLVVIQFDATVLYVEKLSYPGVRDVHKALEIRRGMGGTNFIAPIEYVERHFSDTCALIIITDGEGEYPPYEPSIPIIWVLIGRTHVKPPFGKIIYVR